MHELRRCGDHRGFYCVHGGCAKHAAQTRTRPENHRAIGFLRRSSVCRNLIPEFLLSQPCDDRLRLRTLVLNTDNQFVSELPFLVAVTMWLQQRRDRWRLVSSQYPLRRTRSRLASVIASQLHQSWTSLRYSFSQENFVCKQTFIAAERRENAEWDHQAMKPCLACSGRRNSAS